MPAESTEFLLYGATGFVGSAIARKAVDTGMTPIIAGRNADTVKEQAFELDLPYRVFSLDDRPALDASLQQAAVVLHCAGPFMHTSGPVVESCLRTGTHYLDITGELPVFRALAARDAEARDKDVMLLPGVGFDVVPTDCLAVHLKQRLPAGSRLTLAFHSDGPAGLPPGTASTMIELIPHGQWIRRDGELIRPPQRTKTKTVDFGSGPVEVTRITWGDVVTAYHSTGIPDIEVFTVLLPAMRRQMALMDAIRPLFRLGPVRSFFKARVPAGSTPEERAKTKTSVWGEVEDDRGQRAASRLHGPEAGVEWTAAAALAAVQRVLSGQFSPGFQTPARAFGSDFVLDCEGVRREDLP